MFLRVAHARRRRSAINDSLTNALLFVTNAPTDRVLG
jgi:hypothetical protein